MQIISSINETSKEYYKTNQGLDLKVERVQEKLVKLRIRIKWYGHRLGLVKNGIPLKT
jgi:hypothetical protein